MDMQADKFRYLPLLMAGIAVILSSTAGIAAVMRWLPAPTEISTATVVPVSLTSESANLVTATGRTDSMPAEGAARTRIRCAECGVIVSMREMAGHDEDSSPGTAGEVTANNPDEARARAATRHEIIIRLTDGSSRVINHASAASWRPGERVIVIDGANPLSR